MTPSEEDIANFLIFAPEAGEGKAFLFLEVSMITNAFGLFMQADVFKGSKDCRRRCQPIL